MQKSKFGYQDFLNKFINSYESASLFEGLRPVMDGFVVTEHKGTCEH